MARDVVCGMDVDETGAKERGLVSERHGQRYYFCSETCKDRFDDDPAAFAVQVVEPNAPDGKSPEGYAG